MVGTGDTLHNPAFAFKTAFNVAAVGKHVLRSPSATLSRRYAWNAPEFPCDSRNREDGVVNFLGVDCTMVTLRTVIFAHLHHAPHCFINRTTSNLRIGDLANCLDESDNSRRALKSAVAVFSTTFPKPRTRSLTFFAAKEGPGVARAILSCATTSKWRSISNSANFCSISLSVLSLGV
jgi:hypothetical protein